MSGSISGPEPKPTHISYWSYYYCNNLKIRHDSNQNNLWNFLNYYHLFDVRQEIHSQRFSVFNMLSHRQNFKEFVALTYLLIIDYARAFHIKEIRLVEEIIIGKLRHKAEVVQRREANETWGTFYSLSMKCGVLNTQLIFTVWQAFY